MPVRVYSTIAKLPTETEDGIIGVKVVADSPVQRSIHIALVLDTSGSMDGERIAAVKNTLGVLIDKLQIDDKITIVGFSSKAVQIAAGVTISDAVRLTLKASVDALIADGGTNMESGVAMLGSLFADGAELPDSLVLLTDGFVNEGISSVAGMYSLLKSYLPNVSVYALGYGDNHNSDFMRGLSQRTSGTYTFIDNEIALPASIGELLGALQGEVAKAAELTFPAAWTCLELGASGNKQDLGSLIADKPTWTMLSVPKGTQVILAVNVMSLNFKYIGSTDNNICWVDVDTNLDRLDVLEHYLRCVAASALDTAAGFIKAHNISDAKSTVEAAIVKITTSEAGVKPLAIRMKAQLEEMNEMIVKLLTTPPRRADYTNLLQRTTSTATRYQQQRGVSSQGGDDDDDMFSSPTIIRRRQAMVAGYTQSMGGSAHADDPNETTS